MSEIGEYDLIHHLEQAVQELDADSIGLAHNMGTATLDQLHEIVAFAERLKQGALIEMWGRERAAKNMNCTTPAFCKVVVASAVFFMPLFLMPVAPFLG
ncbi:hypothetical protein [Devosia sp.]|uniref:hypothetical protein n=1 Tax=Devosia sp. TaxID=1871048 RepID=UPI002732D50B|nr:hypothetical protein [Devosia sp.]MDP2781998.1 hypothetical protein [Devosia sp.]